MDDNWDLQALVRSCTGTTASSSSAAAPAAAATPDHADFDFGFKYFVSFPDPSIEPRGAEELHDLYKPFYPKTALSTAPAQAPASIATSYVSSLCFSSDLTQKLQSHHHHRIAEPALTSPLSFTTTAATPATATTRSSQVNRSKRRKNLVKKSSTSMPMSCLQTCGHGGNMDKNPLKALHIREDITDAAARRVVWPGSKWSGTDPTRESSLSPTPQSTTTLFPPNAIPSPAAPARSPPRRRPSPRRSPLAPLPQPPCRSSEQRAPGSSKAERSWRI